jgi:hypothetical protein
VWRRAVPILNKVSREMVLALRRGECEFRFCYLKADKRLNRRWEMTAMEL